MKFQGKAVPVAAVLLCIGYGLASLYFMVDFKSLAASSNIYSPSLRSNTSIERNVSSTLVYTNVGDHFQFQYYVFSAIVQARKFNPDNKIVLLTSQKAVDSMEPLQRDLIKEQRVSLEIYDDYLKDELFAEFLTYFFIQGDMVPSDGNTQFVKMTSARMFVVYGWMIRQKEKDLNVFHFENDNLMFFEVQWMSRQMHKCGLRLAYPLADDNKAVLGTVYIRTADDLKPTLDMMVHLYKMGAGWSTHYLGNGMINDMTVYVKYLIEQRMKSDPQGVSELSDRFYKVQGESCLWDKSQMLFDSAVVAQWFCGTHSDPNAHFYSDTADRRLADPRPYSMVYKDSPNGWQVPHVGEYKMASLHIHSKQLDRWSSKANGSG